MGDVEDLRQVIEQQARALVTGDLAQFATHATPAALAQFYRSSKAGTARRFEVKEVHAADPANSIVRFHGSGAFELHATWERHPEGWRAVALAIPDSRRSQGWWRRIVGRASRPVPERQDLS